MVDRNVADKTLNFAWQTEKSLINYLIVIEKYYICKTKFTSKRLSILGIQYLLKRKFKSEQYFAKINNSYDKFLGKWSSLFNMSQVKNSNHQCRGRESNPSRLRNRPTLYRVAIKAYLHRKAIQLNHIPITTTYSPSIFRFARISLFEQPLNIRPPSLPGHQAHQTGLFTLGADVTGETILITNAAAGDRTRAIYM